MTNPQTIPPAERELWSLDDLRRAGLGSRTTIWRLGREDASFPRPVRLRGLLRWRPDEVRAWLAERAPRGGRAA